MQRQRFCNESALNLHDIGVLNFVRENRTHHVACMYAWQSIKQFVHCALWQLCWSHRSNEVNWVQLPRKNCMRPYWLAAASYVHVHSTHTHTAFDQLATHDMHTHTIIILLAIHTASTHSHRNLWHKLSASATHSTHTHSIWLASHTRQAHTHTETC